MIVNRNALLAGGILLILLSFVAFSSRLFDRTSPDAHTPSPQLMQENREHYKALETRISQLLESQTGLRSHLDSALEGVQTQLRKISAPAPQAPPPAAKCEKGPESSQIRKRSQRISQLEARLKLHEKLDNMNVKCAPLFNQYPSDQPPPADPKGSGSTQKANEMIKYAERFGIKNWVETGTYEGGTTQLMLPHFNKIYSIEMADVYYQRAVTKFQSQIEAGKVKLLKGDSSSKLKDIIEELDGPALFWLDGHWSGGDTAMGAMDTPIFDEIMTVFNDFKYAKDSVIFIDDARLFKGYNLEDNEIYPNIRELLEFMCVYSPWGTAKVDNVVFEIKMDMMRIHKRKED